MRLGKHAAFRGVVDTIDGCHVRIKAPGEPNAQCDQNWKLYPSVQLQAVCDHQATFLDVFIGFPGSMYSNESKCNSILTPLTSDVIFT